MSAVEGDAAGEVMALEPSGEFSLPFVLQHAHVEVRLVLIIFFFFTLSQIH